MLTCACTMLATGCVGFVQPVSQSVTFPTSSPAPSTPPTEGYLRIWTTADFQGLPNSWDEAASRRQFKKLLVTVQLDGQQGPGQEIPVLALDVEGPVASADKSIDADFGKLAYVHLDSSGGSSAGTVQEPRLTVRARAVPKTAADFIDKAITVGKDALQGTPVGSSIASALPPGTAAIIGGIIDVVGKQAAEFKDKQWNTSIQVSVRAELAQNRGLAVWVLVPDEPKDAASPPEVVDSTTPPSTTPPPDAPAIPPLFACDLNAKTEGRMTHLCVEDDKGVMKPFDRYAWVTMQVELLTEPGDDLVPRVSCPRLQEPAAIAEDIAKLRRHEISQKHRAELDGYIALYESASKVMTADGIEQVTAYVNWLAQKGPRLIDPTPATPAFTPTWSTLKSRLGPLEGCMQAKVDGDAGAKFSYVQAAAVHTALASLSSNEAAPLYTAVSALDITLAEVDTTESSPDSVKDVSAGRLRQNRRRIERVLYSVALPSNLDYRQLVSAIATYARCEYCVIEGRKRLAVMQVPADMRTVPVTEAESLDPLLRELGADPSPLAAARDSLAKLDAINDSPKPRPADVAEAERIFDRDAEAAKQLLVGTLGVSPTAAEAFVRYE